MLTVGAFELWTGGRIELGYEEPGAAHSPEWGAELRAKGQATSFVARGAFSLVEPPSRIAFAQELDFGRPGAKTEYRLTAELDPAPEGRTRVVLVAEGTPSKHWTLLGRANLRAQLDRLRARCESPPA